MDKTYQQPIYPCLVHHPDRSVASLASTLMENEPKNKNHFLSEWLNLNERIDQEINRVSKREGQIVSKISNDRSIHKRRSELPANVYLELRHELRKDREFHYRLLRESRNKVNQLTSELIRSVDKYLSTVNPEVRGALGAIG